MVEGREVGGGQRCVQVPRWEGMVWEGAPTATQPDCSLCVWSNVEGDAGELVKATYRFPLRATGHRF